MYNKILELCSKKGISITELCVQVTGSSGNLATWKKGYMRSDYLADVCRVLDCSASYLIGLDDLIHTQTESEWDAILEQMSDDSLLMFREYAKFLLWRQDQAAEDNL